MALGSPAFFVCHSEPLLHLPVPVPTLYPHKRHVCCFRCCRIGNRDEESCLTFQDSKTPHLIRSYIRHSTKRYRMWTTFQRFTETKNLQARHHHLIKKIYIYYGMYICIYITYHIVNSINTYHVGFYGHSNQLLFLGTDSREYDCR